MPGPSEAAKWLHIRVDCLSGPIFIDDLLLEYVQQTSVLDSEKYEKVEGWRARFRLYVHRELSSAVDAADFISFSYSSAGDDYICGSCFVEPNDSLALASSKSSRANTLSYKSAIEKLTPSMIEILGRKVLSLWGCHNPSVTKHSNDQGIDFHGKIPLGELLKESMLPISAEEKMSAWIVGQAKHYTSTDVGTSDLRELVGSVQLLRGKAFSTGSHELGHIGVRICDPVICFLLTTGRLTKGSAKLLESSGVIALSGTQIAMVLADHKVAETDGNFDAEKFKEWMFG